ncbi:TraE protein, partial [gut metagenome]
DRMLADFLDMESSQIVTMHIQSVDQTAAIRTIKHTITELDRSKIEEQEKKQFALVMTSTLFLLILPLTAEMQKHS